MKISRKAAALAAAFALWAASAVADVKDYEFQLVQSEVKKGDGDHRRAPAQQQNRQGRL